MATTEAMKFLTSSDQKISTNWSVFEAFGLATQLGWTQSPEALPEA